MTIQQLIYSVRQAAQALAVSRVTIYALQRDPSFPRLFKTAGRSSGLMASELLAWVELRRTIGRIDGKRDDIDIVALPAPATKPTKTGGTRKGAA